MALYDLVTWRRGGIRVWVADVWGLGSRTMVMVVMLASRCGGCRWARGRCLSICEGTRSLSVTGRHNRVEVGREGARARRLWTISRTRRRTLLARGWVGAGSSGRRSAISEGVAVPRTPMVLVTGPLADPCHFCLETLHSVRRIVVFRHWYVRTCAVGL